MSFTMHGAHPLACRAWVIGVIASTLLVVGCGGSDGDKPASQTAAKVNKEEITVHQINFALQQQRGLRADQAEAASRQILERLIDQELALQKAEELKLDREPRVVQQLEAARREIVARAYLEKVGDAAVKPTVEEIKKYYDEKPALFSERRLYNLQEISIEARADQVTELRERLVAAKTVPDFIEYLKTASYRFAVNQAVRAAEQLPLANLDAFARMKDGQALVSPGGPGVQVLVLAGSRTQPISEEQARPIIEQFLLNDRKRKLVEEDIKAMRGSAKVTYVGKFGEPAASAPAGAAPSTLPATPSPAAPSAAPSTPLSGADISKGLGLK
jgi:EpsD family peptidyl-prolyl cis-trans isomerase